MASLGILKRVDPRQVWKHEERDFTPWIAENIEQLSNVIGVSFAIDQTEKRVGAYELDIFGHIEGSDAPVIIENQLTATDHKHLGQLLTYAAGLDAVLVIWVAIEVTDEHRAAVDWLNKITGDSVSFYLVRPEVLQIDDSKPAVKFVVEASPSEFKRVLREAVEGEEAPRHEFRRKFWTALLLYLVEHNHTWAANRRSTKESWVSSSVGKSGVGVNVSMAMGSRIRVEIYFGNDGDKTYFNILQSRKKEIEPLLNSEPVSWEPLEGTNSSRVAVYHPYIKEKVIADTPERQALFQWIEKNITIMRDIAKRFLNDG